MALKESLKLMIILKMLVTSVPCGLGSVASNSPSPCLDVANMLTWKKVLYCLIVAVAH